MRGDSERWELLCELAAKEQDSQKLLELTREINDLSLGERERLERPDRSTHKIRNSGEIRGFGLRRIHFTDLPDLH